MDGDDDQTSAANQAAAAEITGEKSTEDGEEKSKAELA
jgi:hypothetical protein